MSGDDDDDDDDDVGDDEVCFPCNKHGRVNTSHRFCKKRNGGMHNTEGITREYTQNNSLTSRLLSTEMTSTWVPAMNVT